MKRIEIFATAAIALSLVPNCTKGSGTTSSAASQAQAETAGTNETLGVARAVTETPNTALAPPDIGLRPENLEFDLRQDSELGRNVAFALHALSAALQAQGASPCTSGSATLTLAAAQTSDCANIGKNGSYPGGATLTMSKCVLPNGATIDGTLSTTVSKALATGATCSATAVVDTTHTLSATVAYTSACGGVLSYTGLASSTQFEAALGSPPTRYTLAVTAGERKRTDPSGTAIEDIVPTGSVTVSLGAATRTVDGTLTVDNKLTGTRNTITEAAVAESATCCVPTGGTITTTATGASGPTTHTIVYSATCGSAMLDGAAQTTACPTAGGRGRPGGAGPGGRRPDGDGDKDDAGAPAASGAMGSANACDDRGGFDGPGPWGDDHHGHRGGPGGPDGPPPATGSTGSTEN